MLKETCYADARIGRYDWQPGNGTRYDLLYGKCGDYYMIGWANRHGAGGTFMMFSHFLHYSYLAEKMNVNESDADGILRFLEKMGHDVGYPAHDMISPYMSEPILVVNA